MAGRKAVLRNGLVVSIKSGGVRIDRDGLHFRIKIRNQHGVMLVNRQSMFLDQLLPELGNQSLVQGIASAFALQEASPQEVRAVLPGFFVDIRS